MDKEAKKAQRALRVAEIIEAFQERLLDAWDTLRERLVRTARGVHSTSDDHRKASQYLERGRRLYNSKDYGKAEDCFKKALEHDPKYALGHYFLGLVYYTNRQLDDAARHWKRAQECDPDSRAASKAGAKLRMIRGRLNEVVDQLESQIKGH
ncbi:MAG: tetratricopeptide repeat protein [Candidatus Hydrogenedentota bacterium]